MRLPCKNQGSEINCGGGHGPEPKVGNNTTTHSHMPRAQHVPGTDLSIWTVLIHLILATHLRGSIL